MSSRIAHLTAVICLALLAVNLLTHSLKPLHAAGPYEVNQTDKTPVVHPPNNSHHAPLTTSVSISYDAIIDTSTVSTQTFAVQAMQTGLLAHNYVVAGGKIELIPEKPLKAGEIVLTTATTRTLDIEGQGPMTPTTWMFRVEVTGGTGSFINSDQRLETGRASAVALGDLDGDGDLDAFVTNDFSDSNIFLNDGQGIFAESDKSPGAERGKDVALSDLDGDGDLDAFIVGRDKVLLNDGHGHFVKTAQDLDIPGSWAVAIGDLDGDADLDLFIAVNDATNLANKVWFNNGAAVFNEGQSLGNEYSSSVALGDVDDDGDLDAFVANQDEHADLVYLNDGRGNFTESGQALGQLSSSDVALGDLDSDGDLDALVLSYGGISQVWLNDGGGFFSAGQSWGTGVGNSYYGFDLGDLDSDGDLDVFIADYTSGPNEIWLNDGSGIFSQSNRYLSSPDSIHSRDVALGDLNQDGDLDAFVANDLTVFGPEGETFAEVWFNAKTNILYPVFCINGGKLGEG